MREIKIKELSMQNFKGIENITTELWNETEIRAANGIGKTTIVDSIWWLLFNKDSLGNTKFRIKPFDSNNNDIHNLITEVKAVFEVDGTDIVLAKQLKENWVTRKGTTEPELKGNDNKYFINESEVKKSEYETFIAMNFTDEETFKILTNDHYFMDKKWQDRRIQLLSLIGGIDEIEKEIKSKDSFADLVQEWNTDLNASKDSTNFFKYILQKSKADKEEFEKIPYQIQSLQSTINSTYSREELDSMKEDINNTINELTIKLDESKKEPQELLDAKEEINKVREILSNNIAEEQKRIDLLNKDVNDKRSDLIQQIASLKATRTMTDNNITSMVGEHTTEVVKREEIGKQYISEKNNKYFPLVIEEQEKVCSKCGQDLPLKNMEEHNKKLLQEHKFKWDKEHEEKLKHYETIGLDSKSKIEKLLNDIEYEESKLKELDDKINSLEKELDSVAQPLTISETFGSELKSKGLELKSFIDNYVIDTTETNRLYEELSSKRVELDNINVSLGELTQVEITKSKIVELQEREKELQRSKIKYELLVIQSKQFEKEVNEELENRLSDKFDNVTFKLFNELLNGGFEPTCDVLLNGSDYQSQSNGEKILTGVEIIKAFQKEYEIKAPIFIDNRESLTLPIEVDSQTISMYVDESKKELEFINADCE